MHRLQLLNLLDQYQPYEDQEAKALVAITGFIKHYADCFERSLTVGHVTGSAWLIDSSGERVLLTHHRKLGKWLQLGGHADGDSDVRAVAKREAQEESGLANITPISGTIFDVDVHRIPAYGNEPVHHHYDVRFLLQVKGDPQTKISDESLELSWFTAEQMNDLEVDSSVRRMQRKWVDWQRGDYAWPSTETSYTHVAIV